jgi:hypothetical protein
MLLSNFYNSKHTLPYKIIISAFYLMFSNCITMSKYTDSKMMKDLEKEFEGKDMPHLLKVVKALIFENIEDTNAARLEAHEDWDVIDKLFKEEVKEEKAAGKVGPIRILYKGYEYEIQGRVVPPLFGMGPTTLEATVGQTAKKIDAGKAAGGTTMHDDLIIQAGAKFEQMPPNFVWTLISNSGRESVRSLEEKLELMRSINVELVDLIKVKLL